MKRYPKQSRLPFLLLEQVAAVLGEVALKWHCFEHNRVQATVYTDIDHVKLSYEQLVFGHIGFSFMLDCEIEEAEGVDGVALVQRNKVDSLYFADQHCLL